MLAEYRARREVVVDGLNSIPGVRCLKPGGAFYVFPNVEATGIGEHELAGGLLAEAGVALLSGTAFGPMGRGHLRLSYAQDVPMLQEGLGRIGDYLASRRPAAVVSS
jgi:aspartate/methionine/tyrosine aminotransferase